MKAHKLSHPGNNVTTIVRRDFLFIVVTKSVINFSVAFEKNHAVSIIAAGMVTIVEDIVLSDFLTGNILRTYQRYISMTKFF